MSLTFFSLEKSALDTIAFTLVASSVSHNRGKRIRCAEVCISVQCGQGNVSRMCGMGHLHAQSTSSTPRRGAEGHRGKRARRLLAESAWLVPTGRGNVSTN
jgi:hypothetical protein